MGHKKDPWRFCSPRVPAPSAHRRPGYSLSGCTPAEPDSASPGVESYSQHTGPDKARGDQRFPLERSSCAGPGQGSPGMEACVLVWVRTPLNKSKKILGVPVENTLTSYFL